jgi:endonuclease/exonuclease/phosphatase family metal-dependent hydrolase
MQEIATGGFAPPTWRFWPPGSIRVVDWNIDRGTKLPAIVEFLSSQNPDLLVLQEVDMNTRRARRLNVAEEVARALGMNYVFGCEFQELAEGSHGSPAYTGQATLSRWPLYSPRLIRFERQSGFWHPRWWVPNAPLFQERLGGRIALVTEARIAGRPLAVYNLHLESRGDDQLRASQLREVIADTLTVPASTPVIVAGDMNVDVSQPSSSGLIEHSGLCDVIGPHSVPTTPRRRLFHSGRAIDRALVRGPVRAADITVHRSVEASDHYPLSFTLRFD